MPLALIDWPSDLLPHLMTATCRRQHGWTVNLCHWLWGQRVPPAALLQALETLAWDQPLPELRYMEEDGHPPAGKCQCFNPRKSMFRKGEKGTPIANSRCVYFHISYLSVKLKLRESAHLGRTDGLEGETVGRGSGGYCAGPPGALGPPGKGWRWGGWVLPLLCALVHAAVGGCQTQGGTSCGRQ